MIEMDALRQHPSASGLLQMMREVRAEQRA
jgi:hypothetical protein